MQPHVDLVVGIPGTGIRNALHRFADRFPSITVFSLEEILAKLAAPYVQQMYGLRASKLSVFSLPRILLKRLWTEAFEQQWTAILQTLDEGRHAILTLHLSYYHHLTREYLTPANLSLIKERFAQLQEQRGPDAKRCIITLIDDIYDASRRLSGPGGFFSPPKSNDDALLDLLGILDWRSMEMLLGDALATACQLPHYLFAVKHPILTFHDLLYSEKPVAYLSHPISEPRRMWQKAPTNRQAVHMIVAEINGVAQQLSKDYVVIQPTTIDEFRFLGPRLDDRWPFHQPSSDALYTAPQPLNPTSAALMCPGGWDPDARTNPEETPIFIRLKDALYRQIGARDHFLVEQSDIVVCYRPLFRGNASRGVEEELKHQARLAAHGGSKTPAVVFCPTDDRMDHTTERLCDMIATWVKNNTLTGSAEDIRKLIDAVRAKMVPERDGILAGDATALLQALDRYAITVTPSSHGEFADGAMGTSEELRRDEQVQLLAQEAMTCEHAYIDKYAQNETLKISVTLEEFYIELTKHTMEARPQ